MQIANKDIKDAIVAAKIKFWQVAEHYGVVDSTFSRKLRHELPDCEKEKIHDIIANLAKEAS